MTWGVLWVAVAMAGGSKWDGKESDVFAERVIAASPEAIWSHVDDVHVFETLLPGDCVRKVTYTTEPHGDERVHLVYKAGWMRRKLSATVTKSEAPRYVDFEHPEPKGFLTRFKLEPDAADPTQTKVTVRSYLNAPPKPFKGVYFSNVRPEWIQCWTEGLEKLDVDVTSGK